MARIVRYIVMMLSVDIPNGLIWRDHESGKYGDSHIIDKIINSKKSKNKLI
jgi:hypothetical protein